ELGIAQVPCVHKLEARQQFTTYRLAGLGGHEPVGGNHAGDAIFGQHPRYAKEERVIKVNPTGEAETLRQLLGLLRTHDLSTNVRGIGDYQIKWLLRLFGRKQVAASLEAQDMIQEIFFFDANCQFGKITLQPL